MHLERPLKNTIKAGDKIARHLPYWIAATVTGLVAVAYAHGVDWATKAASRQLVEHPYIFLATAPIAFVIARLIIIFWAPGAAGSGIPQVMAAIEAKDPAQGPMVTLFGKRAFGGKLLSSLAALLGGAAIGREGPMIQIAACIFHEIGLRYRKLQTAAQYHAWLITGGAAGLAAAFNTPLGGIVFAVEELATPHFRQFKTVLISAVIVSGVVAQSLLGPYLFLGSPELGPVSVRHLALALPVGALVGLSAGAFGRGLAAAAGAIRKFTLKQSILVAGGCGLAVGGLGLLVGPRSLGGGSDVVRELLLHPNLESPALLFVSRACATFLSYLSGCAGGVFAPSLSLGAAFGTAIENVVQVGSPKLMAAIGMTAFLAGLTHAPFTAFVLAVEMTDRHGAIFPLMLAAVAGASASAAMFPGSFYQKVSLLYAPTFIRDPRPPVEPTEAPDRNPL